ncbi:biotin-independent malonate decarboxylase subunit beta, partial [Xanthomonas sp. Kuri4-1]
DGCRDGLEVWRRLGVAQPERLPLLDTDAFLAATAEGRAPWY